MTLISPSILKQYSIPFNKVGFSELFGYVCICEQISISAKFMTTQR